MGQYYGEEAAGAQRIARSASAGLAGGTSTGLLNRLGRAAVSRDVFLEGLGHEYKLKEIDTQIAEAQAGKQSSSEAGTLGFLMGASKAIPLLGGGGNVPPQTS